MLLTVCSIVSARFRTAVTIEILTQPSGPAATLGSIAFSGALRRAWGPPGGGRLSALQSTGITARSDRVTGTVPPMISRRTRTRPLSSRCLSVLAEGGELPGRRLGSHKVLGSPSDLANIVKRMEVHGAFPTRIVVAQQASTLSASALNALLEIERGTPTVVQWVPELLDIGPKRKKPELRTVGSGETTTSEAEFQTSRDLYLGTSRPYDRLKRLIDATCSVCLIVILSPILLIIAVLVALDVGFPIVFWQLRPGQFGHPFKVYKFRTMRGAHASDGTRVPDHLRVYRFGSLLRRSRLDELPQIFNVLTGEMSLVGPRPLLPSDHGSDVGARLAVRPGITGWAQINGGRELALAEKAALDTWYVHHRSLTLDVQIMIRTLAVVLKGEKVDGAAVVLAQRSPPAAETTSQ